MISWVYFHELPMFLVSGNGGSGNSVSGEGRDCQILL